MEIIYISRVLSDKQDFIYRLISQKKDKNLRSSFDFIDYEKDKQLDFA